jgi:hypothetical protein
VNKMMHKKFLILIYFFVAAFIFLGKEVIAGGNSFQITPPPIPYPVFTPGRKDVKVAGDYVTMEGAGLDLTGVGFNGNFRSVPKEEKLAFDGSFGFFVLGGDFSTGGFETDLTMVTMSPQVDLEYRIYDKDKFSLIGFVGFTTPIFFGSFEGGSATISIDSTITGFMYGIPFGLQGGIRAHEKWTIAPFFLFNWILGGTVSTSTTTEVTVGSFSTFSFTDTSDSIDGYIAPSYGLDVIYEPLKISLGGALQIADGGGSAGEIETKTFHLSWHKAF